jgi:hypothetical protein
MRPPPHLRAWRAHHSLSQVRARCAANRLTARARGRLPPAPRSVGTGAAGAGRGGGRPGWAGPGEASQQPGEPWSLARLLSATQRRGRAYRTIAITAATASPVTLLQASRRAALPR